MSRPPVDGPHFVHQVPGDVISPGALPPPARRLGGGGGGAGTAATAAVRAATAGFTPTVATARTRVTTGRATGAAAHSPPSPATVFVVAKLKLRQKH
jgi:hypothetical protein